MFIAIPELSQIPFIAHGFTLKKLENGQNFDFDLRNRNQAQKNFLKVINFIGAKKSSIITCRQVHSNKIIKFDPLKPDPHKYREIEGDALITNQPNVTIAVITADCLPILLIDKKEKAIGAIHAGRKGTMMSIVKAAIENMKIYFNTMPENLIVGIGPGIQKCCYEVDKTIADQFEKKIKHSNQVVIPNPKNKLKHTIDLLEANLGQLIEKNVLYKNIFVMDYCTSCRNDLFFSYRADKIKTGRMLGFIMLKD